MSTVSSSDGTSIAYECIGTGSPLILVHGTGSDHSRWAPILPALSQYFTLYVLDRRGRGNSGDSANYAIEREFEDIAAIANSIESPVDILAHSFGAACALGAADQIKCLRRLVLYEPPLLNSGQLPGRAELLKRMQDALDAGDRETVALILLRDFVRIALPPVEILRTLPTWAGQLAAAHTIVRELSQSDGYVKDLAALKDLIIPTLFLLGGASPEPMKMTTQALHSAMPDSRVIILPGQGHSAINTAPDLFFSEVINFLTASI
jgi:pimeloyl-ACP methyl ester carboxylesterase